MPPATTNPERPAAGRKAVLLAIGCSVIIGGTLSLVAAGWWIGGPVIPARTLKALRGATRSDVRQILGEPSEVMPYGDWIYDRPLNPGWVAIAFDDDDHVRSVNDEQVDPVTFGSGSWE